MHRGHRETWEALHRHFSREKRAPKGRSLIDNASRRTWELTETYLEKWYRRRPERIGTEKGNSDSEHLHSTDERGKPEPKGASGGKADVGGWNRRRER
jgi:hypothetical protein